MKKNQNLLLVALFVTLFSCGSEENEIQDEDKGNTSKDIELAQSLQGKWHFSNGDIALGMASSEGVETIDRTFEFNASGNYSEAYSVYTYYSSPHITSKSILGNWSIESGKIKLNDWEGKALGYFLISRVSENSLTLTDTLDHSATYIRAGHEFDNLSTQILGYWYEYTTGQKSPFHEFKTDGSGHHRSYAWNHGSETPIQQESQFLWEINGTELKITSQPVAYKTEVYTVSCCNSIYLIYGDNALKRSEWK